MSEAIDWSLYSDSAEPAIVPVATPERILHVVDSPTEVEESVDQIVNETVLTRPLDVRPREYTDIDMMRILMRQTAVVDYRQAARAQNFGRPKTTYFNT